MKSLVSGHYVARVRSHHLLTGVVAVDEGFVGVGVDSSRERARNVGQKVVAKWSRSSASPALEPEQGRTP